MPPVEKGGAEAGERARQPHFILLGLSVFRARLLLRCALCAQAALDFNEALQESPFLAEDFNLVACFL